MLKKFEKLLLDKPWSRSKIKLWETRILTRRNGAKQYKNLQKRKSRKKKT